MRDSSSVRLIWSVSLTPGSGGVGALPRGFLPVSFCLTSRLVVLSSNSAFSRFAQLELFGQTHAVRAVGGVGGLSKCQQFLDFLFELSFEFDDVAMRQGAVA